MKKIERFYFGTWQLGGQFKQLSCAYIESLLRFAINIGVRRFDTAAVYGKGKVEQILGSCLPEDAVIVTKIPARAKPDIASPSPIQQFYSPDIIYRSADESLKRLRRPCVDTVLLHNWIPSWTSNDAITVLEYLAQLKKQGLAKRIGISLPDDFSCHVDLAVLQNIDVIEAPFNPQQQWVTSQIPELLRLKKEVLLRSLFCRGKLITARESANTLMQRALTLETSVVVGMTTKDQIVQNIETMKGGVNNEPT